MNRLGLAITFLGVSLTAMADGIQLPSIQERAAIFESLTFEMQRLDAIALGVRANRTQNWGDTLKELKLELLSAQTATEIARVFTRLDLAYPNLHSYSDLGPDLLADIPKPVRPAIQFRAEWIELNQSATFRVSQIAAGFSFDPTVSPQIGDSLLAINGKPMSVWSDENLNFCKFALRGQCDLELPSQLYNELLSWT